MLKGIAENLTAITLTKKQVLALAPLFDRIAKESNIANRPVGAILAQPFIGYNDVVIVRFAYLNADAVERIRKITFPGEDCDEPECWKPVTCGKHMPIS